MSGGDGDSPSWPGGEAALRAFEPVLRAGGETGALILARDWSATPLGPIAQWPQSLRTALGLLLRSPVPIVMLWGVDGVMLYNDAYSVFAGGRHPDLLGSKVREGWPEVADFNDNVMRVGLAGGTLAYRNQELTLHRFGYPEQVWMNLDYSPVYDEAGEPAGVIAIVVETTAEVRAAQDLRSEQDRARQGAERLQISEESLRLATEAAEIGTWDLDLTTDVLTWSDRTKAVFGISPDVPCSMADFYGGLHPEDRDRTAAAFAAALDPELRAVYDVEYRTIGKEDGVVRWVAAKGKGLFDENRRCVRAIGTAIDITQRKAAEERMHLLMREVDHRANNLLSVVQGTVALSRATEVDQLKVVIAGRVQALARAHQLLSDARWVGASLKRLVEEELEPFRLGDKGRVIITGADIALAPAAAQSIAMAVHELATNAAKYGALSRSEGYVRVNWRRDGEKLMVRWAEHGGPPISAAPGRRGLGTTILNRSVSGNLGGTTRMLWKPDGLLCELEIPQSATTEPPVTL